MGLELKAIGSDPEMFLFKKGVPVSAIGLVPGSKSKPYRISEHESVQVDNVAIEFNTRPTLDPYEFSESIEICYRFMKNHLASIDKDIEIVMKASTEFPESELKTRAAKRFGCDPDFNAWSGEVNTPPSPRTVGGFRSCGGHIHLGFASGDVSQLDNERMIRLMDKYVGTYVVSICDDTKRRDLYGKAGAFRPKPYGVEYRTPSITWVKDQESINKVFELTKKAVDDYNEGKDADYIYREAINDSHMFEELREAVLAYQL